MPLVRVVAHEDFQFIGAGLYKLRHIKAESQISVSVCSRFMAVPINCTPLVNCAEMKKDPSAFRQVRDFDGPSVPEDHARSQRLSDT